MGLDAIREGYTRVSEILGVFSKYADVPEEILANARIKGDAVHDWAASFLRTKGKAFHTDIEDLDSQYSHYGWQFLSWYEALGEHEIFSIEERFYDDDLMITGRCDLILKVASKYVLVDYKTTYAKGKDWGMQLAAYAYLVMKNKSIALDDLVILHLKKDEPFRLYSYKFSENFDMFLKCVELYNYMHAKKKRAKDIMVSSALT